MTLTDAELLRIFEAAKWRERAERLEENGSIELTTHSHAGLRAVAEAAAADALTEAGVTGEGTVEWAIQEQEIVDGPWDHIDDGRGWLHRNGQPYTESEARQKAQQRRWCRVVTRTVHYGPWEVAEDS